MIQIDYSKFLQYALCLCFVLSGSACDQAQQSTSPDILRMGVLPDVRATTLESKYGPLVEYLSEELGQEVRLIIPGDYADLVRLFGNGEVDIANFGGATFVSSEARHQAVPLVMRDIDTRFTSYFLARSDAKENQIWAETPSACPSIPCRRNGTTARVRTELIPVQ